MECNNPPKSLNYLIAILRLLSFHFQKKRITVFLFLLFVFFAIRLGPAVSILGNCNPIKGVLGILLSIRKFISKVNAWRFWFSQMIRGKSRVPLNHPSYPFVLFFSLLLVVGSLQIIGFKFCVMGFFLSYCGKETKLLYENHEQLYNP